MSKKYDRFVSTETPVKQYGNLMQFWNHELFGKTFPSTMDHREQEEMTEWNQQKGLVFKELSPDISYLKIPSFFNNDQQIAELIQKNDAAIRKHPYLIIDVRGNGGGNTGWVSLLPYLMTNPIEQAASYVRVSPDNVKYKLADLEPFAAGPIPEEYKKYFPKEILDQYKKAYQELPVTTAAFYPIPGVRFPLDSVTVYPKKVALVVDDRCGSSAEYFFYLTRQSRKTTTYGSNTIGMMDYEGMSIPLKMPYGGFIITIPAVKSSWTDTAPIDETGFTPDIQLTGPYQDWIRLVMEDLKK